MKDLTISLVIPAYNEEKYIGKCLDYVEKNGGDRLLEIIVVDNASTDNTASIAGKYKNVRVIREDKKGVMWARERGRLEACGEIVAFIDADNHMPGGWVAIINKTFNENKNIVCISGPYVYYDIFGFRTVLIKVWNLFTILLSKIIGYAVTGGNFAIRRDILEKMNGINTSIDFYGDDTNIAKNAHRFGKVLFTSKFFMCASGRRFNNQGIMSAGFHYAINFFTQVFANKSVTKSHEDYR